MPAGGRAGQQSEPCCAARRFGLDFRGVKNAFPRAVVHAYEPNPLSAAHFETTTAPLSDVTLFCEGVAAQSGSADIVQGDSTGRARSRSPGSTR